MVDVENVEVVASAPKLSFYNLPYSITEEEITKFCVQYGFPAVKVVVGFDKRKNLPSGSATLEMPMDCDINACVTAFQAESCGGRPIRVQKMNDQAAKRRSSAGKDARYFLNDMSFKCQKCGEVGHKQYDCTNEPIPTPCHLCAGKDHEAVNCPNITCYRCGLFGHHSRDCRNAQNSRPVICTQCGSTTHDCKACRVEESGGRDETRYDSRVEGRWIRCVSCNQFGHTMCQALPKLQLQKKGVNTDVYCPNCGEKGHHIDWPQGGAVLCMAPKYEAYTKYPKLLLDIDSMPADCDAYYRNLIRYNSYQDTQLFPSLAAANSANNNNNSGRTFNMLPSYLPGNNSDNNNNNNNRNDNFRYDSGSHNNSSRNDRNNNNYCAPDNRNTKFDRVSDRDRDRGDRSQNEYGNGRNVTPSSTRPPPPRDAPPASSRHSTGGSGNMREFNNNKKRTRLDSGSENDNNNNNSSDDDTRRHKKGARKSWGSSNDTMNIPQYSNNNNNNNSGRNSNGRPNSSRWSEGGNNTSSNGRRVEQQQSAGGRSSFGGSGQSGSGSERGGRNSSDFDEKVEARKRRFGDK